MNPIEPIRKIQMLLHERAKALGLQTFHTHWNPGVKDDDPVFLTVFFKITPEAVETEDDKIDKEFEALVGGMSDDPAPNEKLSEFQKQVLLDMEDGGLFPESE